MPDVEGAFLNLKRHVNAGSFIRLAFGYLTLEEIEAGIARLGESVREARGSKIP